MNTADQEDETILTYDKYAESWASDHPQDDYRVIITRVKQLVSHGSVLEVGCGSGQDAEMLTTAGYNYFGIDAASGMVSLASRKYPEIIFKHLNLYDLARLKRQFDIFWCNAVLLHIPRRRIDEALRAIATAVKPTGIGFIAMKDGNTEIFEKRTQSGRQENRIFVH